MAESSSNQASSMHLNTREGYQIKWRTMKLEEGHLTVQVENPVDFVSLTRRDCDVTSYLRYKDLLGYFTMLDGPTYENLVRYF